MQQEIRALAQKLETQNQATDLSDGFYDNVFKTSLIQGKTTIMLNQELNNNSFTMDNLLKFWLNDPDHRPFGQQGVVIGAYMEIPTPEVYQLFKLKQNTKYRFAFITHIFILDGEQRDGFLYPRPRPVALQEYPATPYAIAVHYTAWDKQTGTQLYPPFQSVPAAN